MAEGISVAIAAVPKRKRDLCTRGNCTGQMAIGNGSDKERGVLRSYVKECADLNYES
jgi:hypothetical protein